MTTTIGDRSASNASASAAYLTAVGAALAGVSDSDRQELLDDLAEHLAELEHESDAGLVERLGPPEQYAAELLASAGIEASPGPAKTRARWAELSQRVVAWSDSPATAKLRGFMRELRPGWWVARGLLIVVALGERFGSHDPLSLPYDTAKKLLYFGAIAAAIFVSVKIGRGPKWGTWLVSVFGVIALVTAIHANSTYINRVVVQAYESQTVSPDTGQLTGPDGKAITNIYPYDLSGKPLKNAFLADQDGIPIDVGNLQTVRDAGGTFVSGLFPQPNVVFNDQTGLPHIAPPTSPRVSVPELGQLSAPTTPRSYAALTPTTARRVPPG